MTGLNPDFVNMDVEMATPGGKADEGYWFYPTRYVIGVEGNMHMYISPDDRQRKRENVD